MIQHFRLVPFLAGIALGVVIFYFYKQPPLVIFEYPHPQNVKERVYRDKNGVCYKYNSQAVNCDSNESGLRPYPIQG